MRNAIAEYLEYSDEEKKILWENATFVFDTNVLLNLYRYSKETRDILLDSMKQIKDRVWMPYQVAYEFMKDRDKTIYDTTHRYDKLQKSSEKFLKECCDELRLKPSDEELIKLKNSIQEWLDKKEKRNNEGLNATEDAILETLLILFDGKVGNSFSSDELEKIYNDGKERFRKKIPPGYKDDKKCSETDENNMYGDLILWKQILDYAKQNQKSIIFITHDQKEDWWYILHGQTIGPRIELKKEFMEYTKQQFHMYNMETYIQHAGNQNKNLNDERVIEEIKITGLPIIKKKPQRIRSNNVLDTGMILSGINPLELRDMEDELNYLIMLNESRVEYFIQYEEDRSHGLIDPDDYEKYEQEMRAYKRTSLRIKILEERIKRVKDIAIGHL